MKRIVCSLVSVLLIDSIVVQASADESVSTAPTTPTSGEVARTTSRPVAAFRTERNSLTLLFTGVGLALTGLGGLGGGFAGTVLGRQSCDDDALASTRDLPVADGAKAYDVVYSRCVNRSGAVVGGTAAMIAGGAFTAMGAAFIVAGAWRVTVPVPVASGKVPNVEVGLGSVGLRWAF